MTQSSPHASTEMSLSAVYRQLDDRLGADDAQYDVDSGSQRFLAWLCDEVTSEDERRHVESGIEAERQAIDHELLQLRMKALDRTTHARQRSLLIAMCAVALCNALAAAGLIFTHISLPVVVSVGALALMLTSAVGFLHRATMNALGRDLRLSFNAKQVVHGALVEDGSEATARPAWSAPPPARNTEIVHRSRRAPLLVVLGGIAAAGFAVAIALLPHNPNSWIPIATAAAGVLTLLASLLVVVIPAVWSRRVDRRESAKEVLYAVLGINVRIETEGRSAVAHPAPRASSETLHDADLPGMTSSGRKPRLPR